MGGCEQELSDLKGLETHGKSGWEGAVAYGKKGWGGFWRKKDGVVVSARRTYYGHFYRSVPSSLASFPERAFSSSTCIADHYGNVNLLSLPTTNQRVVKVF
ncbi:hypothetical protein ACH5RR_026292 [Cinchona calisaya]|uniref:Uncharacterized protein n=1 Tax=Cinchona calisaya TaxID=153742 RepID=A0ABD2Z257_9GENT